MDTKDGNIHHDEQVNGVNRTQVSLQEAGSEVLQKTHIGASSGIQKGDLESEFADVSCGIWRFRTNIFGRCFSNLYVFALLVGISGLFTSMVDRIVPVQLKSFEKQFNINNAKAGLLTSSSKFGMMSTILLAGHFAKRFNIPMIVGLSGLLQGLLLMIPALLQFTHPYTLEIINTGNTSANNSHEYFSYLCNSLFYNNTGEKIGNNSSEGELKQVDQLAFYVVLVIQVLKGITDTFHSFFLPTVYMDDNVLDKSKMSIFMGIRNLFTNLAQPIGTEINGVLTEMPIDLKKTSMDATDDRFVAAWWLAFFIFGAGTVLSSFPLVLFPKRLISKKQQKQALDKAVITFAGGHLDEEKNVTEQIQTRFEMKVINQTSDHPDQSIQSRRRYSMVVPRKNNTAFNIDTEKRRSSLLFPPTEVPTERKVSLTGEFVFEQPVVNTHADNEQAKESKMIELIKDFPNAIFRLLKMPVFILILVDISIVSIPYNGIAMFRNTYMANEYNIRMSEVSYASGLSVAAGHISGTLVSSWLASRVKRKEGYVWIMLASYLIQTALNPFYILFGCDNLPVYGSTGQMGVPVNTSSQCDCTHSKQLISCGSDGNNYLSPCYAGCSGVQGKNFIDCTLLQNVTDGTSMVTPGLCPTDCHTNFLVYVILHGVQYLVEGASQIPRNLLILRLVDVRDRAFAVSFMVFFGNVLSVPSPNIFGSIIDQTCLIWDGDFCSLYDRDKIRYLLAGVDIGINVAVMTALSVNIVIFRWENRKLLRGSEKQKQMSIEGQAKTQDKVKPDKVQPDID